MILMILSLKWNLQKNDEVGQGFAPAAFLKTQGVSQSSAVSGEPIKNY